MTIEEVLAMVEGLATRVSDSPGPGRGADCAADSSGRANRSSDRGAAGGSRVGTGRHQRGDR
jgi:hypothetical protein